MLRIVSKEGIMLREKYMEGRSTWWRKALNLLPTDGKGHKVQDVRKEKGGRPHKSGALFGGAITYIPLVCVARTQE
jgi:hypothetical protein